MKQPLSLFCLLALSALPLSAAVTTVRHYRLGDTDPGATNGVIATNSLDSAGSNHLAVIGGGPMYSDDAASNNVHYTQRALNFFGTNGLGTDAITNLTDNFGLELWVKPNVDVGIRVLAYNGTTSSNGWGIAQYGPTFIGTFGGVTPIGSTSVVFDQWTHLALVRNEGVATFYVNGVASGTSLQAPLPPAGGWAVGTAPPPMSGGFFDGLLDEVRVFTFAPGVFDINDLTCPSPAARTLRAVREGDTLHLSWPLTEVGWRLQHLGALGTPFGGDIPATYATNRWHAFEPMTEPARLYRLSKECDPAGWVSLPVGLAQINASVNSNKVALFRDDDRTALPPLLAFRSVMIRNQFENTLDVSQAVNPRTCSTNGLKYEWSVEYEDAALPNPYRVAGITGYNSSVLRIKPNSMINTGPQGCIIVCRITYENDITGEHGLRCEFDTSIVNSSLTIAQFNICQAGTNGCTNPNALLPPP